jgi:hypothetical protein
MATILLASCAGGVSADLPDADRTTNSTFAASPVEPEGTVPTVPSKDPATASEAVVEKALADLAGAIKVSRNEITVVSAEALTWPDGSLGCPKPDVFYSQALVDGSRVLLAVGGRLYDYHAGSDGKPFLCESGQGDGGYDFVPPPGFNT